MILLSTTGNSEEDIIEEGYDLVDKGEFESAFKMFDKASKQNPQLKTPLLGKAICLLNLNRKDAAKKILQSLLEIDDSFVPALGMLGDYYLGTGNCKTAKEYYNRTLKISPNNPLSLNRVGRCEFVRGNYQSSIKYYKKAIKLNPNISYFHADLGFAYLKEKKYISAGKNFLEAIKIDNNDPFAPIGICKIYKNKKLDVDKRKYYLEASLKAGSKESILFFFKGEMLYREEKYAEAMPYLAKAFKLEPDHFCPLIIKVQCLIKLKHIKEAKKLLSSIPRENKKTRQLIQNLEKEIDKNEKKSKKQ